MLRRVDSHDLAEFLAYHNLDPFGDERFGLAGGRPQEKPKRMTDEQIKMGLSPFVGK